MMLQFNCLYRWHATTSEADEKWVEKLMGHIFPGKEIESVSRAPGLSMNSIYIHTMCSAAYCRRFQNRSYEGPGTRTRCHSLDVWRVSDSISAVAWF